MHNQDNQGKCRLVTADTATVRQAAGDGGDDSCAYQGGDLACTPNCATPWEGTSLRGDQRHHQHSLKDMMNTSVVSVLAFSCEVDIT